MTHQIAELICSGPSNELTTSAANHDSFSGEQTSSGSKTVEVRLASRDPRGGRLQCVKCGEKSSRIEFQFRPLRSGAPFYLGVTIPTLLNHAPKASDQRQKRPHDGRQIITFTDSRQGTARFASRIQMDAEKAYVRSELYHKLWTVTEKGDASTLEPLRKAIEQLADNPIAVEGLKAQLAKQEALLGSRTTLTWEEARTHLADRSELRQFIPDATRLRYQDGELPPENLAEMFLFREFARRPRSGNSLETLGLISLHFPAVESSQCPAEWTHFGGDTASWRSFLKLSIDFFIRASYCSNIPREYRRWMGMRFSPKVLLPPETMTGPPDGKVWPSVNASQSNDQRLKTLLRLHLGLKQDIASDELVVDRMLRAAWSAIFQSGILDSSGDGSQLNFRKSELRLATNAEVCPVTRRMLDTTLGGVSPYHTAMTLRLLGKTTTVELPELKYPFSKNADGMMVSKSIVQDWLTSDPMVSAVRAAGVWGELSDRISDGASYFEAAEHSGQIGKARLESLENRFREQKTNLLSCSTTMEMGIDIGGLTCIAMNNAPPGPANWLQRAGRAGRRGISQSSTLTLCRSQPHGKAVFQNPMWPFVTPIHIPQVSLKSEPIVARHVQAFLLGRFLASLNTENATKLDCGWMFLRGDNGLSLCDQFIVWLSDAAEADTAIGRGVERIISRSVLASESLRKLLDNSIEAIAEVAHEWTSQESTLAAELVAVGGIPEDKKTALPEQRALHIQLQRMHGEYLLKELSRYGFLPAHGFPIDVLPFVNTSVETILANQRNREPGNAERDDNRFLANDYPSRQLPIAIREYAPGNSVVIDGLSYRSGPIS